MESKQDLEFMRDLAMSFLRPNHAYYDELLALIDRLNKRIWEYGKK